MSVSRPLVGWPNHAVAGEMTDPRLRRLCQGLATTNNWVGAGLEVDAAGKLAVVPGLLRSARLGGGAPSVGYRPGAWYRSHVADSAAVVMVPDRLYLVPLLIHEHVEIDRIGVDCAVGTGGASSARMGIYRRGRDGLAGTLLIDAGTVDTQTAGAKELACQRILAPGGYWLALVTDGAPHLRRVAESTLTNTLAGYAALSDTQPSRCLYGAHTYGALPVSAFDKTTVSTGAGDAPPALAVRILRELAPPAGPGGGFTTTTTPVAVGAGTVSE